MNNAEVSEILSTYPELLRDASLELHSLELDLEYLYEKRQSIEKTALVKLYHEYPTIPEANDPLGDIRKEKFYGVIEADLLHRAVQADIRNLKFRITSLKGTIEFYTNKLRATLLLVDIERTPR